MPPSNPHPTAEADRRGQRGEDRLRHELTAARASGLVVRFFRPEWFVEGADGTVFIVEAKAQEIFKKPPFDGHGLPVHQAKNYIALYQRTGIRTLLRVYDPAGWRYSAWLDELEAGEHFDTRGTIKTPRRVYRIESFKREPLAELRDAA